MKYVFSAASYPHATDLSRRVTFSRKKAIASNRIEKCNWFGKIVAKWIRLQLKTIFFYSLINSNISKICNLSHFFLFHYLYRKLPNVSLFFSKKISSQKIPKKTRQLLLLLSTEFFWECYWNFNFKILDISISFNSLKKKDISKT